MGGVPMHRICTTRSSLLHADRAKSRIAVAARHAVTRLDRRFGSRACGAPGSAGRCC